MLIIALQMGAAALPVAALAGSDPPRHVADELLVQLRPGVSEDRAQELYRGHGAAIIDHLPQIRTHLLRVPAPALEKVQAALSRRPEVEFVEKNHLHAPDLVPNDPGYSYQWHLPKIMAPQAWDYLDLANEVTIAILDSGVDATHPDLAGNLVAGYNFYNDNTDTSDVYGHGTQVAGAAAAITDNDTGVASVPYQAFIMPIRVTDTYGMAYTSTLAQGLIWAADHGARVMNMSFGSVAARDTITSAAQYAVGQGAVVVAAAGNCGCDDPTPENPYMISVGATDSSDNLASFSSRGVYVDLAAPGASIYTTINMGGYDSVSGTSFASPVTAGLAAAMLSANPALTPAEVETILETTAEDLGEPGYDTSFGFGRVNAQDAVVAALGSNPSPDNTPPSSAITFPENGATLSGTVSISVSASDNVGVTKVDLYRDGILIDQDYSNPFSFAWDTSQEADGPHTLMASAYDAAGNWGSSPEVAVTVQNQTADATPPITEIADPSDGAIVTKVVKVKVQARDNVQVQQVEFYVDGALQGSASAAADAVEQDFVLNTKKIGKGAHIFSARAFDAAGNQGASLPVAVTVK